MATNTLNTDKTTAQQNQKKNNNMMKTVEERFSTQMLGYIRYHKQGACFQKTIQSVDISANVWVRYSRATDKPSNHVSAKKFEGAHCIRVSELLTLAHDTIFFESSGNTTRTPDDDSVQHAHWDICYRGENSHAISTHAPHDVFGFPVPWCNVFEERIEITLLYYWIKGVREGRGFQRVTEFINTTIDGYNEEMQNILDSETANQQKPAVQEYYIELEKRRRMMMITGNRLRRQGQCVTKIIKEICDDTMYSEYIEDVGGVVEDYRYELECWELAKKHLHATYAVRCMRHADLCQDNHIYTNEELANNVLHQLVHDRTVFIRQPVTACTTLKTILKDIRKNGTTFFTSSGEDSESVSDSGSEIDEDEAVGADTQEDIDAREKLLVEMINDEIELEALINSWNPDAGYIKRALARQTLRASVKSDGRLTDKGKQFIQYIPAARLQKILTDVNEDIEKIEAEDKSSLVTADQIDVIEAEITELLQNIDVIQLSKTYDQAKGAGRIARTVELEDTTMQSDWGTVLSNEDEKQQIEKINTQLTAHRAALKTLKTHIDGQVVSITDDICEELDDTTFSNSILREIRLAHRQTKNHELDEVLMETSVIKKVVEYNPGIEMLLQEKQLCQNSKKPFTNLSASDCCTSSKVLITTLQILQFYNVCGIHIKNLLRHNRLTATASFTNLTIQSDLLYQKACKQREMDTGCDMMVLACRLVNILDAVRGKATLANSNNNAMYTDAVLYAETREKDQGCTSCAIAATICKTIMSEYTPGILTFVPTGQNKEYVYRELPEKCTISKLLKLQVLGQTNKLQDETKK